MRLVPMSAAAGLGAGEDAKWDPKLDTPLAPVNAESAEKAVLAPTTGSPVTASPGGGPQNAQQQPVATPPAGNGASPTIFARKGEVSTLASYIDPRPCLRTPTPAKHDPLGCIGTPLRSTNGASTSGSVSQAPPGPQRLIKIQDAVLSDRNPTSTAPAKQQVRAEHRG